MSNQSVIKFAQELLLNEERNSVSPALINAKIDQVLAFQPAWQNGFDRDSAITELVRRFSLWVGTDSTIHNDDGHKPWLEAARKTDWRYWQRYREYLESRMSILAVDALDRSTDTILGMLEDPLRDGPWDRRGLVVGHVQSGAAKRRADDRLDRRDPGAQRPEDVPLCEQAHRDRQAGAVRRQRRCHLTQSSRDLGVGQGEPDTQAATTVAL